jgi:5-hydroxyisourate hydrolase-like protein (transthyretin family)
MRTQLEEIGSQKLLIVSGAVNSDGTIQQGTGFSVTKQGTGIYAVRFQKGKFLRSFQANPFSGTGIAISPIINNPVNNSVLLYINTNASTNTDGNFSFIATIIV